MVSRSASSSSTTRITTGCCGCCECCCCTPALLPVGHLPLCSHVFRRRLVQFLNLAGDHIDHIFTDVCHAVGDALDVVRDKEQRRRRLDDAGVVCHRREDVGKYH